MSFSQCREVWPVFAVSASTQNFLCDSVVVVYHHSLGTELEGVRGLLQGVRPRNYLEVLGLGFRYCMGLKHAPLELRIRYGIGSLK